MTVEPRYPTGYDGELDITPVAKHNWKSADSRDRWLDSLTACREAFPLVELLAVGDDDAPRELAQIGRARLRDPKYFNRLSENGLVIETSHDTAYVATDRETAHAGIEAANDGDERRLAELYGFPDCCIDAFEQRGEATHEAPIYEIACASDSAVAEDDTNQTVRLDDPNPLLNIIWQYLGWTFLSHIPCSFNCDASHDIATAHGSLYRELGVGDEAEDLWEFLGTPTTWSGYHGLSNIRNGYLIGSTNTPEYWDEKIVIWQEEHAEQLL